MSAGLPVEKRWTCPLADWYAGWCKRYGVPDSMKWIQIDVSRAGFACLVLLALLVLGCGQIADKDRIRVAKVGDRYITRGDLFKLIREAPDAERPIIRNRSDLLRVLNQHIDSRIKLPLGRKLAAEGKVSVPREYAREQFFREAGDEEGQLRAMWQMEVPQPGVITLMMQLYGLTPELLQFNKDNIEEGTDRMIQKLQGEQAVEYLALEALQEGRISVDEAEIQREYAFMKDQMVTLEEISFLGIRFVADDEQALSQAAALQDRLAAGETFDELVEEFRKRGEEEQHAYVFRSEIMNNPTVERFRGFWTAASGAGKGDILGPVFLPAYQQVVQDRTGRTQAVDMPAAYIVFKVLEHTPEGILDYEQARPLVVRPLLVAKIMHLLRDEHGVEIYENNLPDPSHVQGPAALF